MKVLFILTYYYPHWTGLTQYARRLAEGLAQKGHIVNVLTTKHEQFLSDEEVVNKVHIIRKPVLFRLSRSLVSLQFIFSFWKQIQSSDYIIIYLPFAEVLIVAIIARMLNKRLYLVHNGDLMLPSGLVNRILEKFYFFSTLQSIKLSRAVIIQTKDYAEHSELLSKCKEKWQVILPLYESHNEDREKTKILKKKLLPHKKYTVGLAGRFVEEKGFDILLKAIPKIVKQNPNIQFIFAGEVNISYENFLMKNKYLLDQNKKHLVLLGKLNNSQMTSLYKLCDVFVISSRTDCFPSAEVEALLSGVPVVVTDIPGARWPVSQTKMGIIVASKDSKELADGILEVLKSRRKYIKNKYKAKQIFDYNKTLDIYDQLLQKKNLDIHFP